MSEDDSVKHEGKWTQADLPDGYDLVRAKGGIVQPFFFDTILDVIVDHLNTHYPKPAPDLLSSAADAVLDAEDRVSSAKRERDAAIARAEAHAKGATRANLDRDTAYEELADMTNRAEKAERELAEEKRQHSDTIQVTDEQYTALMRERDDAVRERCYWKARAEEAEADLEELSEEFADFRVEVVAEAVKYRELNPPVFDVDVERTIRAEFVGEGFRTKTPVEYRVVRAVCELFGVEAEQAVDLIEEKAVSAFKVAWHEADMHGDEGNRTRRGIRAARKVIEEASGE